MKMFSLIAASLSIAECAPQDHANMQGAVLASLEADDRCAAEDVQCGLSLLQTRVRMGRNADKLSRVLSEAHSVSEENSAVATGLEGDSILEASMTPSEAKLICAQLPGCKGFTFQYGTDQDGPVTIHFRSRLDASDPALTTVTMDSQVGGVGEEGSELAKKYKEESSSMQQPTSDTEDDSAKTDAHGEFLFEAVDGGDGRACRGLSGADHSEMYFSLESASTVGMCKDLCAKAAGCVGISFGGDSQQCEVWNKPAFIGMSVPLEGHQCHRFLGRNSGWNGHATATTDPKSDMQDITEKLEQLTAPEKKDDKLGSGLFDKIEKLGAKVLDHDGEADGSDETIEMMHQMHEAAKTLEKFEKEKGKKMETKKGKTQRSAHQPLNQKEEDDAPIKAKHKKNKDAAEKAADHNPTEKEQGEFSEIGTSIVEQIAKIGSKIFALEEGMKHSQGADATAEIGGSTAASGEASFSEHDAYSFVGGDFAVETATVQQAKAKCSALSECVGFSYKGTPTDQEPVEVFFKSTWESAGLGWTSFRLKAHKADKQLIQKALTVIENALNKTEEEQITDDKQIDGSVVTSASSASLVSQNGGATYDFQAVDGGADRACRGLSSTDSFAWYYELASADSLEGCKELCVNAPVCKGIEYNSDIGVCEIWTREQGIGTSASAAGYECHRLVAVERSPSSPKFSSKNAALIQMGEVAVNDTTNAVETAWNELKAAHLGFDGVDGGVGRACRGSSEVDNSTDYYAVENAASLDGCKLLCVKADGCVGIGFHNPTGRCEVWKRPQGVGSSTPAENYECHRFLGLGVTLTEQKSYTFAGDDLLIESMTLEQAKTKCAVLPGCKGFTSQEMPQGGAVEVHFKSKWETLGQGWTSFHLEARAPVSPIKESVLDSNSGSVQDGAPQTADAPSNNSSQIAQMGSDLLNQIAKLGNQMTATHDDSSAELSMDDVQKMINDAVHHPNKGHDMASHGDSPKPGKVNSEKLTMQDVQKMIDDAVRQKQHALHKEQKRRVVDGTSSTQSMNGQMDELKVAVAGAKHAEKSVSKRHFKSTGKSTEKKSDSRNDARRQPVPKKEQGVWADKMRESAEDLKIVQAPLTNHRRARSKSVGEEQLLHEGRSHKQHSKAQQQQDQEMQQHQDVNSKRIHDGEDRQVLKNSEEQVRQDGPKTAKHSHSREHEHNPKHVEMKHKQKKEELNDIPQQQLNEQHRAGQRETQRSQRVQKSVQQQDESQHVQHYQKQQKMQKTQEQQTQSAQQALKQQQLQQQQLQQQQLQQEQDQKAQQRQQWQQQQQELQQQRLEQEQQVSEQARPAQRVQHEQQARQQWQLQQQQLQQRKLKQEQQTQQTQQTQQMQQTPQTQQTQQMQQAQQAQQVQQVQQMLNEQQQVQQEQDQQEQWAQQDQQEAEHQQLDEQEQLKLEKQRQKQDSWFKKHLLPKPKAIKEMADLQDQKAAPSVTSQQDVEVGAEAVVIADAEASTEASKEAGSESITEASTEVRAEETQKAGKKASDEASKEVSKEVSEDESNESNEESREKSTEKVSSAKEMADQSADKKTSHAKKHGKKHDSTLDVAVRAAKATTEAVASLSDMKDQKDGSLEELQAQTEHLNNALDAAEDATAAMNDQVDLDQLVQPNQQKQPKLLVEQSIDEGLKSPHNELLKAPTDSKHLPLLERVGATSAIKEAFQVEQKQHMHLEQQRQKRDQLLEAQQARVQGQLAQEKIQDKEWGREQDWFSQHLAPKHKGHHDRHPV